MKSVLIETNPKKKTIALVVIEYHRMPYNKHSHTTIAHTNSSTGRYRKQLHVKNNSLLVVIESTAQPLYVR
jgi:hypothetical protein